LQGRIQCRFEIQTGSNGLCCYIPGVLVAGMLLEVWIRSMISLWGDKPRGSVS